MIEPTEKDINRAVIYRPKGRLPDKWEGGIVISFNDHVVFVQYVGDLASKGTMREDLHWA